MTRIVAGAAKGRRLAVPSTGTRPTSDRAREAVFSSVESQISGLTGCYVVDLYAGTGALGLEALSRGAARVDLVEADRHALTALRTNIEAVGLGGAELHAKPVERWVREPQGSLPAADLLLADPPFSVSDDALVVVLGLVAARGALAIGAAVVVERPSRGSEFPWPAGFAPLRSRRYGEATMWFGRFDSVQAC